MKKSLFADISLLLVALVWGSTFVLVQNAIASLPPNAFNSIRFFIAALILGGWLLIFERKQLVQLNRSILTSGILLGGWLFAGYAFQTVGLLYTSSSKAGFITGLSVVLVPLFSLFLLKQRPTRNALIGVGIATIGLYLLTLTDITALNRGDAFVLACAIGFAMHIIFTGRYSEKFPTLLLTVIQIFTVSVLSGLLALFTEDYSLAFRLDILGQQDVLIALLITSIFATAIAFFAQTSFQKYTTPTRVALIFAMEPVFAAITAYVWADERLTSHALLGCLCIFAGMIFAELPVKKKHSIYTEKKQAI
ncbi:DMT family transporter [Robertmurraya sp. FSL R5-0851]|uniref:DMT family transporter n=1 Tax=Robertmurraya sp. FSL R5-0851 TaxID=2921584 RepID=UPI0030FC783E